jgi:hypothetical protein
VSTIYSRMGKIRFFWTGLGKDIRLATEKIFNCPFYFYRLLILLKKHIVENSFYWLLKFLSA